MQTVRPANTQLFCRPLEAAKQTASGFLLPDNSVEKPKMAEVINVGAGVSQFKSKDTIIYKSYATTDIKLNGEEFFLVAEDDVLGVVVPADS